jgi:hypothetical protein
MGEDRKQPENLQNGAIDPTETSSGIGPAINPKTAKALGIDIPPTLLGARRVNQGMACANQHDIQINLRRIDPLALIRLDLR